MSSNMVIINIHVNFHFTSCMCMLITNSLQYEDKLIYMFNKDCMNKTGNKVKEIRQARKITDWNQNRDIAVMLHVQ